MKVLKVGAAIFGFCVVLGFASSTVIAADDDDGAPTADCAADERVALTLDSDSSTTRAVLRTATDDNLTLVFTPSCFLADSVVPPVVRLLPSKDPHHDFPTAATATVVASREDVIVTIKVDRTSFSVGEYDATVRINGGNFAATNVKVDAAVKERGPIVAIITGIVGLAAGIVAAAFAAWNLNPPTASKDKPFKGTLAALAKPWAGLAAVVGLILFFLVPGTSAFQTQFADVDFWKIDLSHLSKLAAAAFAVGTGSAVSTLVGRGVQKDKRAKTITV